LPELYIQQKTLNNAFQLPIKDEQGRTHFFLKGKLFSGGDTLELMDVTGRVLLLVKQIKGEFSTKYVILKGKETIATIQKKRRFPLLFHEQYYIKEFSWKSYGNIQKRLYQVRRFHELIFTMKPVTLNFGEVFSLNVADKENIPYAICLAYILDNWGFSTKAKTESLTRKGAIENACYFENNS
jgi:uncharacterized protein YxjI